MKLCDETITVFNVRYDPDKDRDVYHGTVIYGVSWQRDCVSTVDGSGLKAADKVTVRIPETATIHQKRYISPKAYAKSSSIRDVFTLNAGDIIVRGEAFLKDPLPADLHRNYEAFTALSVSDNRRGQYGRHWKVVGA